MTGNSINANPMLGAALQVGKHSPPGGSQHAQGRFNQYLASGKQQEQRADAPVDTAAGQTSEQRVAAARDRNEMILQWLVARSRGEPWAVNSAVPIPRPEAQTPTPPSSDVAPPESNEIPAPGSNLGTPKAENVTEERVKEFSDLADSMAKTLDHWVPLSQEVYSDLKDAQETLHGMQESERPAGAKRLDALLESFEALDFVAHRNLGDLSGIATVIAEERHMTPEQQNRLDFALGALQGAKTQLEKLRSDLIDLKSEPGMEGVSQSLSQAVEKIDALLGND